MPIEAWPSFRRSLMPPVSCAAWLQLAETQKELKIVTGKFADLERKSEQDSAKWAQIS